MLDQLKKELEKAIHHLEGEFGKLQM